MLILILSLGAGLLVGVFVRMPTRFEKHFASAQKYVVYLLILLLGGSIGANDKLVEQLPVLGFESLVIALFTVAGSVLCCLLFLRFLGLRRKENE